MATTFQLAFEQVQLLAGLEPNQAVYLVLQAKAYDPDTPDNPFYTETVGGLSPNDANSPADIVSGTGFYAASLPQGAFVRNDVRDSGTPTPRFALPPVSLELGQILELSIVLAPEVWFKTVNVPASDWDKFLGTAFMTALGLGGFGIWGAAAGLVLGFLGLSSSDEDVQVPCYNVAIAARHVWTGAEVASLAGQGLLQFGPRGEEPSYGCPRIDSFYWLSISQQMQFGTRTPWKAGDCTLDVVYDMDLASRFENKWGDVGDTALDCARVVVEPADKGRFNVSLWEPGRTALPQIEFHNVPLTTERAPIFGRNVYPDKGCPARSVTPSCAMCKRFTNTNTGMYLPGKLLLGVGLRSTHIGARPLLALQFDNDRPLGCGHTAIVPPPHLERHLKSGRSKQRKILPTNSAIRVNRSTVLIEPAPGMLVMSGQVLINHPAGAHFASLLQALTLRLSPQRVLYLYGEYPSTGTDTQCFRLRYRHTDDKGVTITDLMLLPDAAFVG